MKLFVPMPWFLSWKAIILIAHAIKLIARSIVNNLIFIVFNQERDVAITDLSRRQCTTLSAIHSYVNVLTLKGLAPLVGAFWITCFIAQLGFVEKDQRVDRSPWKHQSVPPKCHKVPSNESRRYQIIKACVLEETEGFICNGSSTLLGLNWQTFTHISHQG